MFSILKNWGRFLANWTDMTKHNFFETVARMKRTADWRKAKPGREPGRYEEDKKLDKLIDEEVKRD